MLGQNLCPTTSAARRSASLEGVGVESKHQPRVRVTESVLDGPGIDAGGDPLGRSRVTQAVERESIEANRSYSRIEDPVAEVRCTDRPTDGVVEQKAARVLAG